MGKRIGKSSADDSHSWIFADVVYNYWWRHEISRFTGIAVFLRRYTIVGHFVIPRIPSLQYFIVPTNSNLSLCVSGLTDGKAEKNILRTCTTARSDCRFLAPCTNIFTYLLTTSCYDSACCRWWWWWRWWMILSSGPIVYSCCCLLRCLLCIDTWEQTFHVQLLRLWTNVVSWFDDRHILPLRLRL